MIWMTPLLGGVLIGSGAVVLMATLGRIAGISGILGAVLPPRPEAEPGWRWAFLAGLVLGPPLVAVLLGGQPVAPPLVSVPTMAVAGLLVGVGTGLGRGCTSGHGVCGVARWSGRSLAATITFMIAGAATVYMVRHVF